MLTSLVLIVSTYVLALGMFLSVWNVFFSLVFFFFFLSSVSSDVIHLTYEISTLLCYPPHTVLIASTNTFFLFFCHFHIPFSLLCFPHPFLAKLIPKCLSHIYFGKSLSHFSKTELDAVPLDPIASDPYPRNCVFQTASYLCVYVSLSP